jgi:hypothetical protein
MDRNQKLEIIKPLIIDYVNEKTANNNQNNINNLFCKGKLLGALIMCEWTMEEISSCILIKTIKTNMDLIVYDKRDKTFTRLCREH